MGFLDFLLGHQILNDKRRDAVTAFRKKAIATLEELARESKSEIDKELYYHMIENVKNNPLVFYPRKNIKEEIVNYGPFQSVSVTKGEHVNAYTQITQGSKQYVVKSDYINLPAEHVFHGDKMTVDGVFTIAHEYAHFPKPVLGPFAQRYRLNHEQAEELAADILSAKLAAKLGFSEEQIMPHFYGREIVYGSFPFMAWIKKVVERK